MIDYGFGKEIEIPETTPKQKKPKIDASAVTSAVQAGEKQGFVDRAPTRRSKPGPKRREPQGRVNIPGPERVIIEFRDFCAHRDMSLWEGLEALLENNRAGEGN